MRAGKQLVQAFENRLTITGVLAVMLVGGAIYLTAIGRDVPDWMLIAIASVMGFFFGGSTAPKQFRTDDAERIQSALYDTLPPGTKFDQMQKEFERERRKRNG